MQDEIMLKRLIVVKRLYLDGVDKATHQHNYADQILAAISLFLAVETLMGAVILAPDQQPDKAIGTKGYAGGQPSPEAVSKFKLGDPHKFEQLFNQVVAILRSDNHLGENEKLFEWAKLERLQKARNDAQHGAKAPHPSDLPELASIAQKFIERVIRLIFSNIGTSLAEVSLASLIEDEVLRRAIELAETALLIEKNESCTLLARVAFLLGRLKRRYDWWKDRKGDHVIDNFDTSYELSKDWGVRTLDNRDTRLLFYMMREVSVLPYLFDNWILGLDNMDRNRLLELTPRLIRYPDKMVGLPPSDEVIVTNLLDGLISEEGHWEGANFQTIPNKNECLWVLDFITDTLLRWQQEERGRYAAVDTKYLDALVILEKAYG